MNTLKEFKNNMAWTMIDLNEQTLENIYNSIDTESYTSLEEIENDFSLDDHLIFFDTNLHSVIENFSEIFERGLFRHVDLYYIADEDMYIGVYGYDIYC